MTSQNSIADIITHLLEFAWGVYHKTNIFPNYDAAVVMEARSVTHAVPSSGLVYGITDGDSSGYNRKKVYSLTPI